MIRTAVSDERRYMPRTAIEVPCTLSRRSGSAISAQTLNLGPGGMRITSERPLAPDEVLRFDLPDQAVDGRCRVLRQDGHRTYALRFEALPEPARDRLVALSAGRP
jgi:PilZ domain